MLLSRDNKIEPITEVDREKSRLDTLKHRGEVRNAISIIVAELNNRAEIHDESKLQDFEIDGFAEYGPKLKTLTYGSIEYKECLKNMNKILDHHYKNNSHHPEHYPNGIAGMDLVDLLEMICDWFAATKRHQDGDILKSLELNKSRFNISDDLQSILQNTVERYFHQK